MPMTQVDVVHEGGALSPLLVQIVQKMKVPVLVTEARYTDQPGSNIVYANPAFLEQTGYALDEILGRSPHLLVGERTNPETVERLVATLRRQESFEDEMWIHRKDGSPCRVRWNITPLVNEDGDITHFFAVQEDVTSQLALVQDLMRRPRLSFEGLSLPGVIQLLEMEMRTCLLRVTKGSRRGELFFERGKLVGAEIEDKHGNCAALEILTWPRADLDLVPLTDKPVKPVTHSVQHLLFESARRQDEMRQQMFSAGSAATAAEMPPRVPVCPHLLPVMEVQGAEGLALVSSSDALVLGIAGGAGIPDLTAEARANAAVVRAQLVLVKALDPEEDLEEMWWTLGQQHHIIRIVPDSSGLFVYAVFDKETTNLVLARRKLEDLEHSLNAGKSAPPEEAPPRSEARQAMAAVL